MTRRAVDPSAGSDPVLRPLLEAEDADARQREVERLITGRAEPVLGRLVRRAQLHSGFQPQDIEDLRGAIILRLVQRLTAMPEPVLSFDDFVAATVFHAIDDLLRKRYPRRAALRSRLRYALTTDPRLDLRTHHRAALAEWPQDWLAASIPPIARADATAVMLDAARPADALHALLARVGAPVDLDDLVRLCGELWQVAATNAAGAEALERIVDPQPHPAARAQARQSLALLWAEVLMLPAKQRAALLLNLRESHEVSAVPMLIISGVATMEEIAAAAGMTRAELEAVWDDLPLEDAAIALRLGLTRQQVTSLRKTARERLARRRHKLGF